MVIRDIIRNKVVRNASWIVIGRIVQMLIGIFVGVYTARYLGPSNYGLINYGGAYTSFFMSFCTLGINSVIVKELLDHKSNQGMVLGTSLFLKGIASFISALLIISIVSIIDKGSNLTIVVVALCSLGLIFNVLETLNYWFQSRLESKASAVAMLIGYFITSIYRIYLLINKKSVVYFAFASSVDYITVGITLLLIYKKHNGTRFSFSWDYGKSLLNKSYHFILSSIMVAIYSQTDKIMIKQMINHAENGYYSVSIAICRLWVFILIAIIDSMYPIIVESYKKNDKLFNRSNRILYSIIFYISGCFSLIITIFAPYIIKILYGVQYLPAVESLRIVTWNNVFSYLGVARDAWIVCKNRQVYLKYIYFSAAIANVILNFILIPSLGSVGAALASFLTQVVSVLLAPFFIKDMRENCFLLIDAILLKDLRAYIFRK